MLVEDTFPLAEEIAYILHMEGYRVTLANSALQALRLLASFRPDLIITDLLMPVMGGFELIATIRSDPAMKSIPIIILSAETSHSDKIRSSDVGANAFIHKPCKAQELKDAIDRLLG